MPNTATATAVKFHVGLHVATEVRPRANAAATV